MIKSLYYFIIFFDNTLRTLESCLPRVHSHARHGRQSKGRELISMSTKACQSSYQGENRDSPDLLKWSARCLKWPARRFKVVKTSRVKECEGLGFP